MTGVCENRITLGSLRHENYLLGDGVAPLKAVWTQTGDRQLKSGGVTAANSGMTKMTALQYGKETAGAVWATSDAASLLAGWKNGFAVVQCAGGRWYRRGGGKKRKE